MCPALPTTPSLQSTFPALFIDPTFSSFQQNVIQDSMDNINNKFGGPNNFYYATKVSSITYKHVTKLTCTGSNDVACYAGNNVVELTDAAFSTGYLPQDWYPTHEVGHLYDFTGSGGNPAGYKSQAFVNQYSPGCKVNNSGCSGSAWSNVASGTTPNGQKNSIEDFADTFTIAVLANYLPFHNFTSQWRLDTMNAIINGNFIP
jgi:hypothetical protein